ncbi:MAG: hypothetical protein OEZ36_05950 [Spirochaetota bacterium]|nr:hypothetical protein [Spirochaetota bacterium]
MSFQEKSFIVSLFANIVIFAAYSFYIYQSYPIESLLSQDNLAFWAKVILIYIPVSIVIKIVIYIIFLIINSIATKEETPDQTDEMDRLIELKATRNCFYVFFFGFVLSLGVIIIGWPVWIMFVSLFLSFSLTTFSWDISHIYYYRKGI